MRTSTYQHPLRRPSVWSFWTICVEQPPHRTPPVWSVSGTVPPSAENVFVLTGSTAPSDCLLLGAVYKFAYLLTYLQLYEIFKITWVIYWDTLYISMVEITKEVVCPHLTKWRFRYSVIAQAFSYLWTKCEILIRCRKEAKWLLLKQLIKFECMRRPEGVMPIHLLHGVFSNPAVDLNNFIGRRLFLFDRVT